MSENEQPICWACGELMEWTGEYREIDLEGGFMGTVYEPIYECTNPECNDDEDDGVSISDEEQERLESAVFGGHKDMWIEVDGHQQRVLGDPNMSEETKKALAELIKLAAEAVARGDFDSDNLRTCIRCGQYETTAPHGVCWRCKQQEIIDDVG